MHSFCGYSNIVRVGGGSGNPGSFRKVPELGMAWKSVGNMNGT